MENRGGSDRRIAEAVNPGHYRGKSIQPIEIIRHWSGSLFTAAKYAWRAGLKDLLLQDLKKCEWYLLDFEKNPPPTPGPPPDLGLGLATITREFTGLQQELLLNFCYLARCPRDEQAMAAAKHALNQMMNPPEIGESA